MILSHDITGSRTALMRLLKALPRTDQPLLRLRGKPV